MNIRRLAVLAACLWLPHLHAANERADAPPQAQADEVRIHVVGNGWHAGLIVPAAGINEQVPALRARFPDADHYEIGWGDIGFYQATEVTLGLALQALFASKGAVLHVVGLPASLDAFVRGSEVAALCVTRAGFAHMARQIADAFVRGEDGKPMSLGAGIYGNSQFYKARGRYSMLRTCNRWSAGVLEAGGLPISPRLSLTAGSVLGAVRRHGKACATAPATSGAPVPASAPASPPEASGAR